MSDAIFTEGYRNSLYVGNGTRVPIVCHSEMPTCCTDHCTELATAVTTLATLRMTNYRGNRNLTGPLQWKNNNKILRVVVLKSRKVIILKISEGAGRAQVRIQYQYLTRSCQGWSKAKRRPTDPQLMDSNPRRGARNMAEAYCEMAP